MTGFSTESFAFLRELGENNNRDWFNENKAQFTAHLEQRCCQTNENSHRIAGAA